MSKLETHWKLMYPSNWLSAADLRGRDAKVRIKSVSKADLNLEGRSEKKQSVVIEFEGKNKKLVANKTNLRAIAKMHGPLTADWAGKEVVLYPTTCKLGREMVDCIRIRGGTKSDAAPWEETGNAAVEEVEA